MEQIRDTRVWVDGCYDVTHFGHANMLRQAKSLGTKLIVGVHSDEDIRRVKRPPVYSLQERLVKCYFEFIRENVVVVHLINKSWSFVLSGTDCK